VDIEEIKQEAIDNEHLRLLEIFHYISGGLTIAFSCLFIFHLIFMSYIVMNPEQFMQNPGNNKNPDPSQFMSIFVIIFGLFIILGISYGVAQIISGRFIKQRRRRVFSFIVAIPNILFIPYGTILGILTLMVLSNERVKRLYEAEKR
jgi:hypothetical protein